MARRLRNSAVAVALMAVSADASAFSWQQRRDAWHPPAATLALREPGGIMAELKRSPDPTPAPVPKEAIPEIIKKRASPDNTCGYVSGIAESSLYCDVDSMCVYNSANSVVGCCPDTSTNCQLATTCIDSSDGLALNTIGSATLWCFSSSYPSCLTHVYDDDLLGYTLYGCAVFGGRDSISFHSSGAASTGGGFTTATQTGSTTTTTDSGGGGGGGGSSNSGGKKKSKTGGIVGGVVGGIAGAAVLAAAAFFAAKRKKKAENNATPAMANIPPPGGPGPAPVTTFPPQSPPMPGQPQMAINNMGPAPMYPPPGPGSPPPHQQSAHIPSMYSMGPNSPSPGTEYATTAYPSGVSSTAPMMSPPLPSQSGSPQPQQMYAQPPYGQQPPPPHQGFGAAWAPPPQQPPPPQQQQGFVAELPTEKGHGEVRELPG